MLNNIEKDEEIVRRSKREISEFESIAEKTRRKIRGFLQRKQFTT